MRPQSLSEANRAAIAAFLVEHSLGALSAAHIDDRLRSVIASPAHAVGLGAPLRGAATLVDTCHNLDDAAELTLFANDTDAAATLLTWGEALARRGPRSALEIPRWPRFGPTPALLAAAGYAPAYTLFTMRRPGGAAPATRPLPAGFSWEDLSNATMDSYYQTVRLAFAEVPGAFIPDAALFAARAMAFPIRPRALLCGGQVAGYLRVERDGDAGHIASLGRHPDYRGAGLGEHLIEEALRLLAGVGTLVLEVAARNERALALYRRYGFRESASLEVWMKRLSSRPGTLPGR